MREIILIFAVSLLLLSGCTRVSDSGAAQEFRRGSEGISLSFVPDIPPSEMYDNMPIDLAVEVRNRGAHPPTASGARLGTLYLSGFDNTIIQGMPSQYSIPSLEGRSYYNPEGGFDIVNFKGRIINFDQRNLEKYDANFLVTACYSYETIASQIVCIDPEPHSTSVQTKVCTIPPSYSLSGGQGGPVAVTRIEQKVLSDKIQFKITFRNIGNGRVVDKNRVHNDCPLALDYTNLNKVHVSGRVSTMSLTCTPRNPINLINNEGNVICTIPKPAGARSAYTTPIQITLEYGYTTSARKTIRILNTP